MLGEMFLNYLMRNLAHAVIQYFKKVISWMKFSDLKDVVVVSMLFLYSR
jgi:hypothetical protein